MGVSVGLRSRLPTWPLSPSADGPAIVVGEVHHPVRAIESPAAEWLTIPERGLYTGVAIFGAVGSGKTSACMHPVARQLLSWQATNPERRAAALVLEVKGDFCHDIRRMLAELDRSEDYIELSLNGRRTWNPLSATWLDSYSLAYTVASLLNPLFGKGKEPFWQQAYTNLVRWIIELYLRRPQFSWTRIKGESDVEGGGGHGWVEASAGSGVGADGAAVGAGALAPEQRWSASRKRDVVLRLLRGESLDAVSREVGLEVYRLEAWKARAPAGIKLGLKAQAGEPLAAELDAAKRHIGELSMENGLLRERARAAERRLPLATRRSRR